MHGDVAGCAGSAMHALASQNASKRRAALSMLRSQTHSGRPSAMSLRLWTLATERSAAVPACVVAPAAEATASAALAFAFLRWNSRLPSVSCASTRNSSESGCGLLETTRLWFGVTQRSIASVRSVYILPVCWKRMMHVGVTYSRVSPWRRLATLSSAVRSAQRIQPRPVRTSVAAS